MNSVNYSHHNFGLGWLFYNKPVIEQTWRLPSVPAAGAIRLGICCQP